ncbi:electron transfer flavoprotein subunit alpha/FixB family protein [Cellulosimicrobium marinum]|uniref:electron transfer flavoprotein subunit alpha/FixB family protein n=1 Tax=Cellulosimicrobium marinum TaxID=1638992 RepID=UPI001E5E355C|nr:electron transfer flavoprotein subunit alpha/FixB family protein [Cellulosimicrobium marinum]MCB7138021.1 electron transfer flavoprotein subunit alpha/FixB family protein [Cellulosimicrobium marinum]
MTETHTPAGNRTVLVLLDTPGSELRSPVLELLTLARGVGRVEAVALESPSVEVLAQLGSYGVETVRQAELSADGHGLGGDATHLTPVVAEALAAAVRASDADAVLLTSSFPNKEAAARLAFLTGAGLVVDASALSVAGEGDDAGRVVADKRVFAGAWDVRSVVATELAVLTVRANSVVPEPSAEAVATDVVGFAVPLTAAATAARVVERTVHPTSGAGRPALGEAAVVVTGGRGTNGDFAPVVELADALGAAVGATRDAVYEGWHDQFVGQTGVTVAPRLYIGAGVSGAPHHRGGMQAAQVIVAVNNDPECPLFEISDFAVVGDLADVLPQAAEVIREHRAAQG